MRRKTEYSCIPTAIGRSIANRWMLHHRAPHGAFERLERHGGKLARAVLRGPGGRNLARLPGALEDYQKLVDAQERGDVERIAQLGKALEVRIKSEAKDIRDKYIDPPYTTDFGLLFLPYESLYAEVLRRPGLFEHVRQQYRVVITGPTTTQAILNSFQMGFRTLSIQKRSSEVWALLSVVKTEFGKFGTLLEKTHRQLQQASNTLEDAARKSRTIEGKLRTVEALPHAGAAAMLASPGEGQEEERIAPL